MPNDDCGTYAGWNRHQRERTPVCDPCRAAQTRYMRGWRKENRSGGADRERRMNAVRSKAVWILAGRHRDEFDALVRELTPRDIYTPRENATT